LTTTASPARTNSTKGSSTRSGSTPPL